jgi:hypothetical protein
MTKRLLGTVALLAIGAVFVLSSCGGGGSNRLTKEELATKMNTLCTTFNKKVDAVGTPKTIAEAVASYSKLVPVYEKLVADIAKLKAPADEEATLKQAVSLGKEQTGRVTALIGALKKNDVATYTKLSKESNANDKKSDTLFKKLGATACVNK